MVSAGSKLKILKEFLEREIPEWHTVRSEA